MKACPGGVSFRRTGSRREDRLYFWAHGEGIVRYLAADSEDGSAFRVVNALSPCLYHNADRAVGGAAAVEAGLRRLAKKKAAPAAGEALAPAALISNDATYVYQLPDGSFEMYSVTLVEVEKDDARYAPQDNLAGRIRVIDRFTSEDGLRWGNRQRILEPDGRDPSDLSRSLCEKESDKETPIRRLPIRNRRREVSSDPAPAGK